MNIKNNFGLVELGLARLPVDEIGIEEKWDPERKAWVNFSLILYWKLTLANWKRETRLRMHGLTRKAGKDMRKDIKEKK